MGTLNIILLLGLTAIVGLIVGVINDGQDNGSNGDGDNSTDDA